MDSIPLDILVADDEQSMREFLDIVLTNEGYKVQCVSSGEQALEILKTSGARIFIQDMRMGGLDGMELLDAARTHAPDMPILVMTAFSTSDVAIESMRRGSFDFLRKPFQNDDVRSAVRRAMAATSDLFDRTDLPASRRMVGNTTVMRELLEVVERIAPTDSTVMVTGESGCGKELVARAIHDGSGRHQGPFVAVNCSAFTEGLLESELFGHVKGAFTGAIEERKGVFLNADGGTLFLDEVADMSLSTQVRILRSLESRQVIPVGGDQEISTDVRIIAATNKNLIEEVRQGRFREDLYYRLNVIPLHLPPLRDRKDDLPLLAGHFLRRHAEKMGKTVAGFSDEAWQVLLDHDWPGNVRELENVIQRQVALARGPLIESFELATVGLLSRFSDPAKRKPLAVAETVPPPLGAGMTTLAEDGCQLEQYLEEVERSLILQALERTGGNQTRAAQWLGVSYRQIRYRSQKLGIRSRTVSEAP
ncbi:MAG: sigma-54 dependent transcriptional regulator [Planctomycetota bacterium]|nr:sigma-54 dependent transcriptional regulator [Planctomycetota bacterium]